VNSTGRLAGPLISVLEFHGMGPGLLMLSMGCAVGVRASASSSREVHTQTVVADADRTYGQVWPTATPEERRTLLTDAGVRLVVRRRMTVTSSRPIEALGVINTTEQWTLLVEASDAWTRYLTLAGRWADIGRAGERPAWPGSQTEDQRHLP
jgi:hypothetical protein